MHLVPEPRSAAIRVALVTRLEQLCLRNPERRQKGQRVLPHHSWRPHAERRRAPRPESGCSAELPRGREARGLARHRRDRGRCPLERIRELLAPRRSVLVRPEGRWRRGPTREAHRSSRPARRRKPPPPRRRWGQPAGAYVHRARPQQLSGEPPGYCRPAEVYRPSDDRADALLQSPREEGTPPEDLGPSAGPRAAPHQRRTQRPRTADRERHLHLIGYRGVYQCLRCSPAKGDLHPTGAPHPAGHSRLRLSRLPRVRQAEDHLPQEARVHRAAGRSARQSAALSAQQQASHGLSGRAIGGELHLQARRGQRLGRILRLGHGHHPVEHRPPEAHQVHLLAFGQAPVLHAAGTLLGQQWSVGQSVPFCC